MGFDNLGNAVRKVQIDLGVEIAFGDLPMIARPGAKDKPWDPHGEPITGTLLYIKDCLPPEVPADVLALARDDSAFPHDSTADQFFTESRFESYRKVGRFIVETISIGEGQTLTAWLASL